MPNEQRGRLDDAIDRAVRGMMQIDPRPGLRHRVAGQLHAPARRVAWILPTFAAAALCAIVVVAIVLLRSPITRPVLEPQVAVAQPGVPTAPPARATEPRVVAAAPGPPPAPTPRRRSQPDGIFGTQHGRISAASLRAETPAVAAPVLESSEPAVDPGGLPPFAAIAVRPIEMTPIAIAPLSVSALPIRR
jgi:hypothetical protein